MSLQTRAVLSRVTYIIQARLRGRGLIRRGRVNVILTPKGEGGGVGEGESYFRVGLIDVLQFRAVKY